MVRLKSLVEVTRVLVVEVMSKVSDAEEDGLGEGEMGMDDMDPDVDEESTLEAGHGMDVARVYASTIVELGFLLPGDAVSDTANGQS